MSDKGYAEFATEVEERAVARKCEVPFSRTEYSDRLERLCRVLQDKGIELAVVTSPEGMYYLHGYRARWYRSHSTSEWPALAMTVVDSASKQLTHFDLAEEEYLLRLTSICNDVVLYPTEDFDECLDKLTGELRARGWNDKRCGFERGSYRPSPSVFGQLVDVFDREGCTKVDITADLRGLRRVKSEQEIAYTEQAASICDIGLRRVAEVLEPGMTEKQVWGEMILAMSRAGGEHAALHELINGRGFGLGHTLSSDYRIQRGDVVRADPCGVVNRYHANVAGTFSVGPPSEVLQQGVEDAAGAFRILEEDAKDGTTVAHLNAELREYYKSVGIWEYRTWVGGYELGASFPPDWVGEFMFTVDDVQPPGIFQAGMVTNFESHFKTGKVLNTLIYGDSGSRTLSRMCNEVVVCGV